MAEENVTQMDIKKLLSSILSNEAKRTVRGLLDGSIDLDVPKALEFVRTLIYTQAEKEYLTALTLRFSSDPTIETRVSNPNTGQVTTISVPISINESKLYRNELVKHIVLQSTRVWTEQFRDSVAFAAAASVNKQPEGRARRRTSLEDLIK